MVKRTKIILSVSIASVLLLTGGILTWQLWPNNNFTWLSLDRMAIRDFSEFQSIGAGFVNEDTVRTSSGPGNRTTRLLGIRNGIPEEIVFEDENGNAENQTWHLTTFAPLRNFTLLDFSTSPLTTIRNYVDTPNVLHLLAPNGKLYNISGWHLWSNFGVGHLSFTDYNRGNTPNLLWESENALFGTTSGMGGGRIIHRLTITDNDDLKIEEMFNTNLFPAFRDRFFVCRFGNIFSMPWHGEIQYMVRPDRTLVALPTLGITEHVRQSMATGVVYAGNQAFNANGQLVPADSITITDTGIWHPGPYNGMSLLFDPVILQRYNNENLIFRLGTGNYTGDDSFFERRTYTSTSEFTYSRIQLNATFNTSDQFIFLRDRLYVLTATQLFHLCINTGERTNITTNFFLNRFWGDTAGNIHFIGIDATQNNVTGIIDENDNFTVNITTANFQVIFVRPVN
ncbi:MAG: hypothetical protein FWC00_05900 [Firmicutes bacterium]|nr:hypothetical protein [Bacillota bacterium]